MTFKTKTLLAGVGLLALTACGDSFNKEAGSIRSTKAPSGTRQ